MAPISRPVLDYSTQRNSSTAVDKIRCVVDKDLVDGKLMGKKEMGARVRFAGGTLLAFSLTE